MLRSLISATVFAVALLTASFSQAVSESEYGTIYHLLAQGRGSFYQHYYFSGEKNKRIVFTRYGSAKGTKGSLVISPGRTESSLKYLETAYDFIQQGYSPVYVINHRGQGLSDRMLADTHKGHVEDFGYYMRDFARFMDYVLKDKNIDKSRLFAIAHSMGGAIITDYAMNYASPFKAVAMSAPMFKIPLATSEDQLLRDTFLACYVQFACDNYIPDGGPFTWAGRVFDENDVTHSRTRFHYRDHLWRTWPSLQLGSPTIRWVRESVQGNIKRRDITKLKHITSPFLILQAEEELVVDNTGHAPICQRMAPHKCRIERVRGSYHEMLMEKDSIRKPVVTRILSFFANPNGA